MESRTFLIGCCHLIVLFPPFIIICGDNKMSAYAYPIVHCIHNFNYNVECLLQSYKTELIMNIPGTAVIGRFFNLTFKYNPINVIS